MGRSIKNYQNFSKILSSLQPRRQNFIKTVTWTKIFARIVIFVQKCHFLGQKRGNFPPNFRRLWRRKCVVVVNFFADFGDQPPPLGPAPLRQHLWICQSPLCYRRIEKFKNTALFMKFKFLRSYQRVKAVRTVLLIFLHFLA